MGSEYGGTVRLASPKRQIAETGEWIDNRPWGKKPHAVKHATTGPRCRVCSVCDGNLESRCSGCRTGPGIFIVVAPMDDMAFQAIGYVQAVRPVAEDDFWGGEESCIALTDAFTAEALQGLEEFSHVEVLFLFHGVDPSKIVTGARHPRNTPDWPAVGIFAQRGKNRPNRIGSTVCRVVGVRGTQFLVAVLDAIDGTPVLDIKPVMREFLPRQAVRQPEWSHALMREYWLSKKSSTE